MQKLTWQEISEEKIEIYCTVYFVLMIVVMIMKILPNIMQTAADTVVNF